MARGNKTIGMQIGVVTLAARATDVVVDVSRTFNILAT